MKYKKLVPPDSFIGQYLEYMSELETPEAYDFWAAVWCIGTVVGRDVIVDRPRIPVHLNWYIILVAESGITRKGANISLCHDLVKPFVPEIFSGKTPPRTLEVKLHEQTRLHGTAYATFAVPEMVTLLGREAGTMAMPGLLTDLYDCHKERNSGGNLQLGATHMENVYVNFITASTPAWLGTAINPAVIEGGFTSRCIFVCETKRKKIVPWPDKIRDSDTINRLLSCLDGIRSKSHEHSKISINDKGLTTFTRWYRNRDTHDDPFRSSFEAREDDHLLRLAACLCINDGTLEIQRSHITRAIEIINTHKQTASGMFGKDARHVESIGDGVERVRRIITEHEGPISHSLLYTKLRWKLSSEDFKELITIMHECGLIEVFTKRQGKGTFYKATSKLTLPGSVTEAIDRTRLNH